jgi:nicotinate-nucleotide adenylyltransferase
MGGTFDPIHNGHLMMAEAARGQMWLDEVFFIRTATRPTKRNRPALRIRLRMVELALAGRDGFRAMDMEVRRARGRLYRGHAGTTDGGTTPAAGFFSSLERTR